MIIASEKPRNYTERPTLPNKIAPAITDTDVVITVQEIAGEHGSARIYGAQPRRRPSLVKSVIKDVGVEDRDRVGSIEQ